MSIPKVKFYTVFNVWENVKENLTFQQKEKLETNYQQIFQNEVTENVTFLKEWNDDLFDKVQKEVHRLAFNKYVNINRQGTTTNIYCITKERILDCFGLAYVSSGQYAILTGGTNYEIPLNNEDNSFTLQWFAVSDKNELFAIFWDYEENEKFFKIAQL